MVKAIILEVDRDWEDYKKISQDLDNAIDFIQSHKNIPLIICSDWLVYIKFCKFIGLSKKINKDLFPITGWSDYFSMLDGSDLFKKSIRLHYRGASKKFTYQDGRIWLEDFNKKSRDCKGIYWLEYNGKEDFEKTIYIGQAGRSRDKKEKKNEQTIGARVNCHFGKATGAKDFDEFAYGRREEFAICHGILAIPSYKTPNARKFLNSKITNNLDDIENHLIAYYKFIDKRTKDKLWNVKIEHRDCDF